jgi:DNA-binding transcriptional MerR regulator
MTLRKIREVSALLGVKPYVLRYWETEFSMLRPQRTPGGQRLYSEDDIQLLRRLIDLLYVRKYSIEGARRVLLGQEECPGAGETAAEQSAAEQLRAARELLQRVRQELVEIQRMLAEAPGAAGPAAASQDSSESQGRRAPTISEEG